MVWFENESLFRRIVATHMISSCLGLKTSICFFFFSSLQKKKMFRLEVSVQILEYHIINNVVGWLSINNISSLSQTN